MRIKVHAPVALPLLPGVRRERNPDDDFTSDRAQAMLRMLIRDVADEETRELMLQSMFKKFPECDWPKNNMPIFPTGAQSTKEGPATFR